jgi:hypothetical protein
MNTLFMLAAILQDAGIERRAAAREELRSMKLELSGTGARTVEGPFRIVLGTGVVVERIRPRNVEVSYKGERRQLMAERKR